jgi:hypothetical protein
MLSTIISYLVLIFILVGLLYLGGSADQKAISSMLFGAAFTAFVAFFIERQLRPKIRITKEKTPCDLADGRRFLRVTIENQALWWPLKCIMDRRSAQHVRAWITFLLENDDPVFSEGRRMIGRWSKTPEPIRPISVSDTSSEKPNVAVLWDLSMTVEAIDIASGSGEPLDIVMRRPAENGCRGWHNLIIQRPAAPPEEQFDLQKGRYHALVQVDVSGRIVEARFRIVCDVGIEDFRLEPLS